MEVLRAEMASVREQLEAVAQGQRAMRLVLDELQRAVAPPGGEGIAAEAEGARAAGRSRHREGGRAVARGSSKIARRSRSNMLDDESSTRSRSNMCLDVKSPTAARCSDLMPQWRDKASIIDHIYDAEGVQAKMARAERGIRRKIVESTDVVVDSAMIVVILANSIFVAISMDLSDGSMA